MRRAAAVKQSNGAVETTPANSNKTFSDVVLVLKSET